MELDLSGKKAIVTGGGRGLCRSIAEALHDSGAEVILIGSSGSAVKAAEEMNEYGANVYAVQEILETDRKLYLYLTNVWTCLMGE